MTELLNNLRSANVSLYLLKKEGRKTFAAYRLPNGIDEDISEKYRSNFEHFIAGRSFGTYDFVHSEKNALIELETSKIPLWTSMFESIIKANDDGVLLQKDNFDDDYSVIVIDFSYQTNDRILHTYFVSKYMKTDTWYKKGVKFAFTANGVEKEKQDIKEWEDKHPGEKYQEVWNVSIDSIFDEEGNQDKCIYLADNTTAVEDTSDEVDRLREVVSMMTEKQQRVYELHFLEGYSLTEVAVIMGTSVASVHKHKEKILKFIKENFKRG